MGEDGAREMVLSAGGIKAAFPAVEALVAAAPRRARWRFTAFRPRRDPVLTIAFRDLTLAPENVDCCFLSNGHELGIILFFHGYAEERRNEFGQAGFLLLDEALGEYDVSTKLGAIRFMAFEAHPEAERFPLTELARRFDARRAQLLQ